MIRILLVIAMGIGAVSCKGTGGGFGGPMGGMEKARAAQISAEQRGPWFIGRRYYTAGTRFWGFMRRPGESWEKSQMVIINEKEMKQPDRLPEYNPGGDEHGFDHNYEYKLWGYYTGGRVYDPNSNYIIPEFVLQKYELVSRNPGYLFRPGEHYNPKLLPPYRPRSR
ncbi:MAG: hypothetical protein AAF591_20965 [Verrucomicrobiota bacterium]